MSVDPKGSVSTYGSMYGSRRNGHDPSLSKETMDVLEMGLAALAFGTPAASEAGSIHSSVRGEAIHGSVRGGTSFPNPNGDVQASTGSQAPRGNYNETATTAVPAKKTRELHSPQHGAEQHGRDQTRGPGSPPPANLPSPEVVQVPKLPLPDEAPVSAEEAAERDKIRQEIQEKMQAMRKKMSEEKAAASPPPVAIKSPVSNRSASRSLPPIAPASSGSANSADGDVFWKNLLSDLRLLDNDLDNMNLDVRLDDLDVPYRGRRASSRRSSYGANEDRKIGYQDGSYPSSLVSSRSPSPSALDTPFRAAAKRETLLGASLNSEYGSMRGMSLRSSTSSLDDNFGAKAPNSADRRRPDLIGSDWQRDVDRIGVQALGMLDQPKQSYTEALISRQMPKDSPSAHGAPRAAGQPNVQIEPSPHAYEERVIKKAGSTEPPTDLQVRCTVNSRGAAAHVTWQAAFDSWPSFASSSELSYEVQMIVRWISDQDWNTIYTVTETNCTVEGLKPSYPFAVRVKALCRNWSSEFSAPFEFVTEQSQTTEEVLSAVAADMQKSKALHSRAEGKMLMSNLQPQPAQAPTYLERLMKIRQERAEKEIASKLSERYAVLIEKAAPAPQEMVALASGSHSQPQVPADGQVRPDANVSRSPNYILPYDSPHKSAQPPPHESNKASALPSEVAAVDMAIKGEPKLVQRVTRADSSYEQYRQAVADGSQKVVRRITLDDPANPHHELVKKHYQNHFRRDVVIAPAPEVHTTAPASAPQSQLQYASSSINPQMAQPQIWQENENIYGSIYQAKRRAANAPALSTSSTQLLPEFYSSNRPTVHVTPLTYQSVSPERLSNMATDDVGPLARALGVSQYAPKAEVDKLALATSAPAGAPGRMTNQDTAPTLATGLPVVRAVRVGNSEVWGAGLKAQASPSLSGSVASRRSSVI